MNERSWLDCVDIKLLEQLARKLRKVGTPEPKAAVLRRQRLFALACCRRFWADLTDRHQHALQLLERHADEQTKALHEESLAALGDGKFPTRPPTTSIVDEFRQARETHLYFAVTSAFGNMQGVAHYLPACAHIRELEIKGGGNRSRVTARRQLMFPPASVSESAAQCDLLRDIFGNPYRPVAFDPAWRTEHTVGLAAKMYEDRDFAAMPLLADALEEAGCDNLDILAHCREPGVHVRGCWVVDLVLGNG